MDRYSRPVSPKVSTRMMPSCRIALSYDSGYFPFLSSVLRGSYLDCHGQYNKASAIHQSQSVKYLSPDWDAGRPVPSQSQVFLRFVINNYPHPTWLFRSRLRLWPDYSTSFGSPYLQRFGFRILRSFFWHYLVCFILVPWAVRPHNLVVSTPYSKNADNSKAEIWREQDK